MTNDEENPRCCARAAHFCHRTLGLLHRCLSVPHRWLNCSCVMLDFLTDDDVRREPWALYAQMRAAASPLFRVPAGGPWLVFDYAGVRRVLEDHESFSSAAGPSGATDNPLP